jgi:hypothetical protein
MTALGISLIAIGVPLICGGLTFSPRVPRGHPAAVGGRRVLRQVMGDAHRAYHRPITASSPGTHYRQRPCDRHGGGRSTVRPAICRIEHVKTVREKLRTVIRQGPLKVMMKLPAKPPPPAIVNRTVKMPRRRPNAELKSREHLTDAEIERLMATAWNNRWGRPRRDHDPGVPSRAQ